MWPILNSWLGALNFEMDPGISGTGGSWRAWRRSPSRAGASTTTREQARLAARFCAGTRWRCPGAGCATSRRVRCRNGTGMSGLPAGPNLAVFVLGAGQASGMTAMPNAHATVPVSTVTRTAPTRLTGAGAALVRLPAFRNTPWSCASCPDESRERVQRI